MPKKIKTCYMCDNLGHTGDHVPPKCLFPEQKDSDGVDYRKNLLKVPSCKQHNNNMSGDDQAFLLVIAVHILNNPEVQNIQLKKIVRTLQKDKVLWEKFIGRKPYKSAYTINGELVAISDMQPEIHEKFYRCADKISRGIFYYLNGNSWKNEVDIFPLSLAMKNPIIEYLEWQNLVLQGRNHIIAGNYKKHGENPSIFYFQEIKHPDGSTFMLRLVFYEGAEIMAVFMNPPS